MRIKRNLFNRLADLSMHLSHFVCRHVRFTAEPLPYLFLAICSSFVVQLFAGYAKQLQARCIRLQRNEIDV